MGRKERVGSLGICGCVCSGVNPVLSKDSNPKVRLLICSFCKRQGSRAGFSCLAHPQSQHMTLVKSFMIQRPLKSWRVTFLLARAGDISAHSASRGACSKGEDAPEKHRYGATVLAPSPSSWDFGVIHEPVKLP